jgi:transposase InsO family protein
MCELVSVSRAGYYRHLEEKAPEEEEMAVRAAIQEICVQHKGRYGRRRITAELRRRGMMVNQKRVGRMMREDNLLVIVRRKFVVTTDSKHELEVYLNVAAHMRLTGINQLWVADITYIRLRGEFVFLAVILDRFSRCAVGWWLDRSLSVRLTVTALEQAIEKRRPPRGLVHHSDRGVQYAAGEYVEVLDKHGMIPSMSRPANPYDNAACERFMKTLKEEEIYCREYGGLEELRAHVEEFLDQYYNRQRLHSALGYQTPEEFERSLPVTAGNEPTVRLSFQAREEIDGSAEGKTC